MENAKLIESKLNIHILSAVMAKEIGSNSKNVHNSNVHNPMNRKSACYFMFYYIKHEFRSFNMKLPKKLTTRFMR